MAKIKYEETKADREHLRDTLRRRGHDSVDHIAQALRERWHHGHLRSYRLALELGQPQVCNQVNGLQGVEIGDPGYLDTSTLSKFERWPNGGRRPTAGYLVALAQVFGTSPCRLVAEVDWDKLPALDQLTLRTIDHAVPVTATGLVGNEGMMESIRPQAGNTLRTPSNWWLTPETIGPGIPTERLVTMTNDESARYADQSGNVGSAILDQLRGNVVELSARFTAGPRSLELFGSVRLLRDRVFSYLDGGQPIKQRRDLYFLAAVSCGMLAVASDDLGYPAAGMSQAQIAHAFAAEAGDPALVGWLYTVQSMNCYWNGRPGKAREYARRGAALRPGGTVGVWLPAMEARTSGALGDAETANAAVQRATEARYVVQPGTLDEFGGLLYYSQAKQHFYATDTFIGVGDQSAAITQATAAIRAYEDGPVEEFNHHDVALTHFSSAVANAQAGDLDAAAESARTAFQIGSEHRSSTVEKSARRLHRQLCTASVRTAPLAIETRDQIEEFLSVAQPRLELP